MTSISLNTVEGYELGNWTNFPANIGGMNKKYC